MPEHTYTCDCGVWMSATDAETLAWGIDSHVCVGADPLEERLALWLTRRYQGPFWLLRDGYAPALVRV